MCLLKVDFAVEPNEDGRTVPVDKEGVAYKAMLRYKDRYFFLYCADSSFTCDGLKGFTIGTIIDRTASNVMILSGESSYPAGLHLIEDYEEACGHAYGDADYLASSSTISGEKYPGQIPDRTLVIAVGVQDISKEDPADFSVDVVEVGWRGLLASGIENFTSNIDARAVTIVVARMTLRKVLKSYGFSEYL